MFSSISTETSNAWKARDCDGDGVLNGNEIKDGTDVLIDAIINSKVLQFSPQKVSIVMEMVLPTGKNYE